MRLIWNNAAQLAEDVNRNRALGILIATLISASVWLLTGND